MIHSSSALSYGVVVTATAVFSGGGCWVGTTPMDRASAPSPDDDRIMELIGVGVRLCSIAVQGVYLLGMEKTVRSGWRRSVLKPKTPGKSTALRLVSSLLNLLPPPLFLVSFSSGDAKEAAGNCQDCAKQSDHG